MAWTRTFSSPDRFRSRLGFWKMMPTSWRTALASFAMSRPAMRTVPEVGARVVVRMEMVVVLPAPWGPMRVKKAPGSTAKETPSTALRSARR